MNTTTLIILIAAAVLVVAVVFLARRRSMLKARFGPEYDRAVQASGNALRAEAELDARAKRVGGYHIRPLSTDESDRYTRAWRLLQARFVDDPSGAVNEADALVTDLMARRGYPMAEFDRRAEDLSVDHPSVVNHYREAHVIAARQTEARGSISTEDLRQAVMHYRALFEDLLEVAVSPRTLKGRHA
jgi:hypothetical protein